MGYVDRLIRYCRGAFQAVTRVTFFTVSSTEVTIPADDEASGGSGADSPISGLSSSDRLTRLGADFSKTDLVLETGMTPEAYVIRVLNEADGQLPQQGIVSLTGWSESTVSRTLTEMEEQGYIVRIQFGLEKVIYLPDVAPV